VTSNRTMKPLEWALLICLSILWGGSFFFGKVALADFQPFTIVLGRVGIGALALNVIVRTSGQHMPASPRVWGMFFIMGALNNLIPFSLIFWGQTQIASGLASILNATTPLWTILLAHFLTTDERLTTGKLGGVLVGMTGVAITIGSDVLSGFGLNVLAQVAVLGAAVSYAGAGIYGKRFNGMTPLVVAAGQVTASAIMSIPMALIIERPWELPMPSAGTLGAVLGLGLLCTALAYVIYFRLLATAGATNLLLVTFLIPVSALILGIFILGEMLAPRHFLGMGLIGLALAIVDGSLVSFLHSRLRGLRGNHAK